VEAFPPQIYGKTSLMRN